MSSPVLVAIDAEIKLLEPVLEELNASLQSVLNKIQALKNARNTIAETLNVIVPVDTIVPAVQIETLAEKPIVPVALVIEKQIAHASQVIEEPIVPAVPVKKATKKTIGTQDSSLLPDDYSSVNNKTRKLLSNDKKLTDTDFDIYQQFDAKCIHKEKVKAKYNLYYEGQLLHWINEKGEYSSTYTSGTNFTPFGPNNGDPFKASLFGRTNQKVKGWLFFGTQSNPTSAKTSAKNSEQTSEQTSEQISKIDMDNEKEFPSLEGK